METPQQNFVNIFWTLLIHFTFNLGFSYNSRGSVLVLLPIWSTDCPFHRCKIRHHFFGLYGKDLDYHFLRMFGCFVMPWLCPLLATSLVHEHNHVFLLDIPLVTKVIECITLLPRLSQVSRHIVFHESQFSFHTSQPSPLEIDIFPQWSHSLSYEFGHTRPTSRS